MDYTDWMDGPGGYREWFEENYGGESKGAQPNLGPDGPPPPPPKKS